MSFEVVEKFVSINGEGLRAGEPAVFIRFRGCCLACGYCDTMWANSSDAPCEYMSAEQIERYVLSTGITNVTLTGGEPLLQKDIGELCERLIDSGISVEIETNGSVDISELAQGEKRPVFTLDYKLPGSGMESKMLTSNYEYLKKGDSVKFVCSDTRDLERAGEIIKGYSLKDRCGVLISPVFGQLDPKEIVKYITDNRMNGVRLQLQLHKYIWAPDARGV